jgi:hypothetical protein
MPERFPATLKVHQGGGLAASAHGVLTMHAMGRPQAAGSIDSGKDGT